MNLAARASTSTGGSLAIAGPALSSGTRRMTARLGCQPV